MPPNEDESVQHLKNLFIERKRRLEAKHREQLRAMADETKELDLWARTLGELQGVLPRLLTGEPLPDAPNRSDAPARAKLPINELIDRYMAETNEPEFTATAVRKFISGLGYETTTSTYNSIHEALRRRVAQGSLTKDGTKFKRKVEP